MYKVIYNNYDFVKSVLLIYRKKAVYKTFFPF